MSTHTPGPWLVESDGSTVSMGAQVVIVGPAPDGASRGEERANAALIAAAPDLLSALRSVADVLANAHSHDIPPQEWEGARMSELLRAYAVIARAEGRL